jgi:isopenicillin N synthase-like dioxygenase
MTDAAVPIIDVSPLVTRKGEVAGVARALGKACCESGFFYVVGHGIDAGLQRRLEELSRRFFALPLASKMEIEMPKAGRAWRGFFPVGGELTSGKPDLKEGVYFGSELGPDHPDVRARLPMHGANLFPSALPELRPVVLEYLRVMTQLGHTLMGGLALSLGLDERYFQDRYTSDPFVLFRIFNYPAPATPDQLTSTWGVGEHTDYGVLTILRQDDCGGLEVKAPGGWVSAPPVPDAFVCNIGDMLDRMTGGFYRSTPHRVRNASGRDRLSWPFFFDPSFHARVERIPLRWQSPARTDAEERWDKADVHAFEGTYGDYLLRKVGKVFPDLESKTLAGASKGG